MKPTIGKTYMFLSMTKDVWDAIRETYSDAENASQIFAIKTRLWQMKHGDQKSRNTTLSCWVCGKISISTAKRSRSARVTVCASRRRWRTRGSSSS
ncbi:hypothetical protein CK203_014035 [Vitis vinifera]|uniref:Uncharacterized protein n=1 Tax=Vitis vinifera TaxID=29760 RepID=A0A438JHJ3_VITVI|nr:hypothetical protein CK203_014035 [Vitis vinifera]